MSIVEMLKSRYLGYKATTANLLSVPVYIWACIVTIIVGFMGDRIGKRGYINLCATRFIFTFEVSCTN